MVAVSLAGAGDELLWVILHLDLEAVAEVWVRAACFEVAVRNLCVISFNSSDLIEGVLRHARYTDLLH